MVKIKQKITSKVGKKTTKPSTCLDETPYERIYRKGKKIDALISDVPCACVKEDRQIEHE